MFGCIYHAKLLFGCCRLDSTSCALIAEGAFVQSGREEQSCQALGYCTLNSEYTVAGVLEVTPHAHLRRGKIYGPSPINRTKAKAESLSLQSPFLSFSSSSFMLNHLTPLTPSTSKYIIVLLAFRIRRRNLIIDAYKYGLKPANESSPSLKELRFVCDEPIRSSG